MTPQRTDIHRPSEIQPEDYTFIAVIVPPERVYDCNHVTYEREVLRKHMLSTGGKYSNHSHGGTCFCCGAHAKYLAVFHHEKTNTYIKVGEICADKMELGNENAFKTIKKACKDVREAIAGKNKAKAILTDLNLTDAYTIYENNKFSDFKEENIISEIVSKLVKYGNISDKQVEFVTNLLFTINNRDLIIKQRQEENKNAAECPEGRVEVNGEIISLKVKDTHFGEVLKMLVKDVSGFKVWGSVPKALNNTELKRGDKISFKATIKKSIDDSKFGFFSRPVAL